MQESTKQIMIAVAASAAAAATAAIVNMANQIAQGAQQSLPKTDCAQGYHAVPMNSPPYYWCVPDA